MFEEDTKGLMERTDSFKHVWPVYKDKYE